MIKIKTTTVLKSFEGEPLKHNDEELTLGKAVAGVLGGKVSNPARGWQLGKKFATEEEVDLKAEDVVYIKKELSKEDSGWLGIVVGQIIEILDGDAE